MNPDIPTEEQIARNHERVRSFKDRQTRELIAEDFCLVGQTMREQSAVVPADVSAPVPQLGFDF